MWIQTGTRLANLERAAIINLGQPGDNVHITFDCTLNRVYSGAHADAIRAYFATRGDILRAMPPAEVPPTAIEGSPDPPIGARPISASTWSAPP